MPDSDTRLMKDSAAATVAARKRGDMKSAKTLEGVTERVALRNRQPTARIVRETKGRMAKQRAEKMKSLVK